MLPTGVIIHQKALNWFADSLLCEFNESEGGGGLYILLRDLFIQKGEKEK